MQPYKKSFIIKNKITKLRYKCIIFRLGGSAVTEVVVKYLAKEFMNKYKMDILENRQAKNNNLPFNC